MSIAVSAVVQPSRLLRRALFAYAMASAGATVALLFGGAGRFHFPWLLAAACLLAALCAWRAAARSATTRRIDISGLGEIRLTVQQSMGAAAPRELVQLLPGSTVWPHGLLLLLRDADNGALTVLPILPDSVSHEQFRKIAVSVRAIARRDNKFAEKHKIH
jgi:toxin CptA